MIRSDDLPFFCVVGDGEEEALQLAMEFLPDYLKANVPEYVDIRKVRSTLNAISHRDNILPAHIVVSTSGGESSDGNSPT